jgi:hypothetical protein
MTEGARSYFISMVVICLVLVVPAWGTTYFVNAVTGNDGNPGTSVSQPFRTLERIRDLKLLPGDSICLAEGQVFRGSLVLRNVHGTIENPIVITSYAAGSDADAPGQDMHAPVHMSGHPDHKPGHPAHDPGQPGHDSCHPAHKALSPGSERAYIDAAGYPDGILVVNGAHIRIERIGITADGTAGRGGSYVSDMRCGIRITVDKAGVYENIRVRDVDISDIFYHDPGHTRSKGEVKTANGTGRYGWGIRLINQVPGAVIRDVQISDSRVTNVSHTGIKLTSRVAWIRNEGARKEDIRSEDIRNEGILDVVISGCEVVRTGGPGIQMSGVRQVIAKNNLVDRSGSNDDSRKWGRGSGLWTWSATDVIIEHNQFRNANGPGDSAGCHIDYNCRNVIVQYNLSYHNAGGFVEILGNNYNCAYRYNVSVNDGYRIKGKDGAFQEGKVFWLSGYQGDRERTGPYNSYIYNNTVYTDQDIVAKIAVTKTAAGVLVANNIFCFRGGSQAVLGDQYNPEKDGAGEVSRVVFRNNLFYDASDWPEDVLIHDAAPVIGDPGFSVPGGDRPGDYIPRNELLVKDRGIEIPVLPGDENGLVSGLGVEKDILGNLVTGLPDIGAVELK